MVAVNDKPLMHFPTEEAFADFLEADPPESGIRLQLLKKGDDRHGITWLQAVQVALCYGWIDGQATAPVDGYRVVSFSPRRARSSWSKINREHTERLIAAGRMRPGGQAEIDMPRPTGGGTSRIARATERFPTTSGRRSTPAPALPPRGSSSRSRTGSPSCSVRRR